jgi:purine-nucleoside phosphorylase
LREKSITRPRPLRGFERDQVVYLPFDPPPGLILAGFKQKIKKEKKIWAGRLFLLEDKVVLYQALGAPAAVASLEMLIASGLKEIRVLSFCGSLWPDYRIGDVISASKALPNEGTSPHYYPRLKTFFPSPGLKKRTEEFLSSRNLPFSAAACVSTDAPFRETMTWLKRMQARKIGVVDMEISAVFALAKYWRVEAAALMIVTDELFHKEWSVGNYGQEFKKKIQDYFLPFI